MSLGAPAVCLPFPIHALHLPKALPVPLLGKPGHHSEDQSQFWFLGCSVASPQTLLVRSDPLQ